MALLTTPERIEIAKTRIQRILREHTAASMRTLEMKISDAGPYNQRIDPHLLTDAREALRRDGKLNFRSQGTKWYYLVGTPEHTLSARIDQLHNIQKMYNRSGFSNRLGQALEIAVYRVLNQGDNLFFGRYPSLDQHDDRTQYEKEEPPGYLGRNAIPDDRLLDFIMFAGAQAGGIECKNIREWIYPDRTEVKDLIDKCLYLDCIPVLIARRIHFSTSAVLNKCGIITHQTLRQYLPASEHALAELAKDKRLLGYHDIRLGNDPDTNLSVFIQKNLPGLLSKHRPRWDRHKDLLARWVRNEIEYDEFVVLSRLRENGP